jgi:hypothetical protein
MRHSAGFQKRLCGALVAALCFAMAGCGVNVSSSGSVAGGQLRGMVHGGQQPVSGASIQLYAAATTGYGVNATPLLTSTVTSDSTGSFTITGDYTCPSSTSQLYIVAKGGNPGLTPGTNNAALVLMAALGPCSLHGGQLTLDPNAFLSINEVTTVASVYALAAFMGGDATHLGTSSTNAMGLANSFALVNNLVNTATGTALAATPAGNGVAPQATINTLGNILASCVNSAGVGSPCSALFGTATPVGGTSPTDTVQAIYDIARNPANNVNALYALASGTPPFQPTLGSAPNDWTAQLTYTTVQFDANGNGPAQKAIAIDGSGDAWIANEYTTSINLNSSVAVLNSNGTILSGTAGYTGGGLTSANSIAIDPLGAAWLTNSLNPRLSKFSSSGSPLSGSTGFALTTTTSALAIDGSGNVWCGGAGSLAKFDNSGNLLSGSGYTGGGIGGVESISIDPSENAWLASNTGSFTSSVSKFTNSGSPLSGSTGFTASGMTAAWSIANDNAGDTWVTNNGSTGSVYEFANDGTLLSVPSGYAGGGLANPLGIAIDGAGNAWVTSDVATSTAIYNSVVKLGGDGTVLSGSNGFALPPTTYPVGDAVDGSGNVWVAMAANNVIEIVGVATPVVTPLSLGVKNNTLGTRP